ncbi:MAG TPA: hypothetical protein PK006_08480 [Saprospiraceae bacterium]|nr:hypothetical protein [Saprospiraceae bacterium]
MLKYKIALITVITLIVSCNKKIGINSSCEVRIKEQLKILSQSITFDNITKVYTLNYSKLPPLRENEYRRLSDSLQLATYLPYNENQVKHFLYCKSLENLPKLNCQIKVSDIRKYFGLEYDKGTKNGQIHSLFYVFNNFLNPKCFTQVDANSGKVRKCSTLTFKFTEELILEKVNIESFAY